MAGAIYRHEGKYIDYTPGSAVTAGQVVDLGNGMVGIAIQPIAANATGALAIEGVFEITKDTASNASALGDMVTIAAGASPTFDENAAAGCHRVVKAAAANVTTAWVKINVAPEIS